METVGFPLWSARGLDTFAITPVYLGITKIYIVAVSDFCYAIRQQRFHPFLNFPDEIF